LKQLQKQAGKEKAHQPLQVAATWRHDDKSVVLAGNWKPITPGRTCEHQRKAVVVHGGPYGDAVVQTGEVLFVCTTKSCRVHWSGMYDPPPPRPKPEVTLERLESQLANLDREIASRRDSAVKKAKENLIIDRQDWPPSLRVIRHLIQHLVIGHEAEELLWRRGYHEDSMSHEAKQAAKERFIAEMWHQMSEKEIAGVLVDSLICIAMPGEAALDLMLADVPDDSRSELVAAAVEEVDASYAADRQKLVAKIEALKGKTEV
jgi:hypothetical protein